MISPGRSLGDAGYKEAGKDVRLNVENARRTVTDLEVRLENRKKELQSMRHVVNGTPIVLGGALVVPVGLMRQVRGDEETSACFSADPIARSRIERIAMDAVRHVEESQGCHVVDVSADKCGWDLTSHPPAVDNKQPDPRHIEVKGRVKGAATITVNRNEMLYAFNQGDKFVLAIVLVNEDDLRDEALMVPRILVVLIVPDDICDWLQHSATEMILRRCAYWTSIRGFAATINSTTITVTINYLQHFCPSSLMDIMQRIGSGGLP